MTDPDKSRNSSGENDLRENFDFIQKVADLSPNIMFVVDLEEQSIIYVSNKVKELIGQDPEDILSHGSDIFKMIMYPQDFERRMDNLEKCKTLSDGEESEVECRLNVGENVWEWFSIKEKVFKRNDQGAVTHVLGIAQNIHEQKVGEERLREEHRRLQNAQKIGHIGSFERKLPGDIMQCSEEFYNIFGIAPRPEGITVEDFFSFVHPDDREPLKTAVEKTHATGEPYDTVTRIIRPDRSVKHIHRRAGIITDDHGVPLKVYGTIQDITERVKAEEERKRADNLIRSTEILAGMGSYEVEVDTKKVYFSDGLFRIFGEEPGSFIPTPEWIDQHSHPDDVPVVQEIIDRAAQDKTSYTYKRRIYRSDGSLRILEAHGRFIPNSRGELKKIIGLVQDITERKLAEEELRKSEKLTRNLLEVLQNAPDSYLVLTRDFYIEMASDAYLKATETKREEIIGKYIFDVFPDNPSVPDANGVENLRTSLNKVLSTRKAHRMPIQHYDVRSQKGDFVEKHWSPTNTPVINADGEVEYIIHRVLDITEVMKEQAAVKGLVSETEMLKTSLEEIKLQAKQLRENRSLLQSIFDASPNSIILYKTLYGEKGQVDDFEFIMLNAFNHLSLNFPYDLKGKKLSEAFPTVLPTGILEHFKKTAETGEPADFEVWYEGEGLQNWFHFRVAKLNNLLLTTAEDISERKKAEKELIELKEKLAQKATDKYRKIINSMDEGFCLIEIIREKNGTPVDYRFLETNPVFEDQTGLKDALGKTANEIVPGLELYWKEIYGKVALTGKSIRFENYSEPMGRWFDVNAFRIDAPNEQHVAVMFKDITDRKEAEERSTFLLNLNDAIRPLEDPLKIQDTSMKFLGTHLEVNRAYYVEILGDEDTLAGRQGYVHDIEPINERRKISNFNPDFRRQLQEGQTIVIEDILTAYVHNEDAKAQISSSQVRAMIAVPLVKQGKLVAAVAVQQRNPRKWNSHEVALVEEVCEQTWAAMEKAQAEKALRESEQRFRNLVEASALAVWETEPDGTVANDSISWRSFTGQTYEQGMGTGWLNAVHPDDRAYAKNKWKHAIDTQTNYDTEFRLISASGEARWTSVKAIPILDIEGKVTKWSGMTIDIHDQKLAEEALIQAKEEAEAATRAKEDFLSTMSHEIRTPLNAVIGLTNLLLDKDPRDDQKENLNSLSFSAKNLLALINDILDFSKLEAGKAEVTVTDFDLHGLLMNLKQAHLPLAQNKDTQLELVIDEKIPNRIATDQLKLSQVLHNLVSNAVKFTTSGKVSVKVNLEKLEKETLWLNFEIEDTGIGIPGEKLEHIFEKFTQAESSTVRQYGGTGLGLSITRLLLELMGSEIHLDSIPDRGSRFYFTLPVKKAKKEQLPTGIDQKKEDLKDFQNLRILLVEDVEINRRIIIQFLQNWWQIQPDEAKNGKEAVELAGKNQYDLILMDIRMPVMDGYEATSRISKLPGYENTPILALTADKNQELQQEDHETRFSGLLTKPFEPLDLKKKILLHLPGSDKNMEASGESSEKENSGDHADQDWENREELLPIILVQLKEYKNSFDNGTSTDDLKQLKDLQHKSKLLFQILRLDNLSGKLEDIISSLEKGAQKETRMEILEEGKAILEKAIDQVQEEIKEPVFDISRYTAIAGKNRDVLQKLINNSVRTFELYQHEFTTAANNKDPESLSDLVHKNTTSIHYLQAKRLDRKINEYRDLLATPGVAEEDLEVKQREVQKEFELITAGLQSLVDFVT